MIQYRKFLIETHVKTLNLCAMQMRHSVSALILLRTFIQNSIFVGNVIGIASNHTRAATLAVFMRWYFCSGESVAIFPILLLSQPCVRRALSRGRFRRRNCWTTDFGSCKAEDVSMRLALGIELRGDIWVGSLRRRTHSADIFQLQDSQSQMGVCGVVHSASGHVVLMLPYLQASARDTTCFARLLTGHTIKL